MAEVRRTGISLSFSLLTESWFALNVKMWRLICLLACSCLLAPGNLSYCPHLDAPGQKMTKSGTKHTMIYCRPRSILSDGVRFFSSVVWLELKSTANLTLLELTLILRLNLCDVEYVADVLLFASWEESFDNWSWLSWLTPGRDTELHSNYSQSGTDLTQIYQPALTALKSQRWFMFYLIVFSRVMFVSALINLNKKSIWPDFTHDIQSAACNGQLWPGPIQINHLLKTGTNF